METTTNFKRGFIPIEPWLKTGEWGGTRESASGFYMIEAGALSLEMTSGEIIKTGYSTVVEGE